MQKNYKSNKKNYLLVLVLFFTHISIASQIQCADNNSNSQFLLGYFGDNNVPNGAVAPHLQPSTQGTLNDNTTASNLTASPNVTIGTAIVGSTTAVRVGNINTSSTTPVDYTVFNDYIYSTYTLNVNSPILRLDRILFSSVSGGNGANYRCKITVYDTAAATETTVVSDALVNNTGGVTVDATDYDLQPGSTYQIRIYLAKAGASVSTPVTLDIDNPRFYGYAISNISKTSLDIPCGSTSISVNDLNATVVSQPPANYELRWFKGATDVTAFANIGPGTYIPYYYDTSNLCYHPAGASLQVSADDSDGDGVYDLCDLDDDNDGILDIVECPVPDVFANFVPATITGNNTINANVTGIQFGSVATATLNRRITGSYSVSVQPLRKFTADMSNASIYTPTGSTTQSVLDENVSGVLANINSPTAKIAYTLTLSQPVKSITMHIRDWDYLKTRFITTGQREELLSGGTELQYNPITRELYDIVPTTPTSISNITRDGYGSVRISNTDGSSFSTLVFEKISDPNTNGDSDGFSFTFSIPTPCDTDGDGIINSLDLDSDNDGCLDAIEGDENVLPSQLVNSGGTVTVGTGSSAQNKNLCAGSTCVDSQGVPTVVNSGGAADIGGDQGQGAGDSQNASVNYQCLDSDADGIPDYIDIDDDNDGILDTDEGYCSSQSVYNFNPNATLSNNSIAANGGTVNLVYNLASGIPSASLGNSFTVPFTYSDLNNSANLQNHTWDSFEVVSGTFRIKPNTTSLYTGLPANNTTSENFSGSSSTSWDVSMRYLLSSGRIDKLGTFTTTFGSLPVLGKLSSYNNASAPSLAFAGNAAGGLPNIYDGAYWANLQLQTVVNTLLNNIAETVAYATSFGSSYVFDYTAFLATAAVGPLNTGGRGIIIYNNSITVCNHRDTDGDGIPDYLDLDSDNDGCPDAIEGGAAFTASNLVSSSMPGGNSGATSGTYNQPVVQNLGNTVGNTPTTMGVPTIAGTGQTVGASATANPVLVAGTASSSQTIVSGSSPSALSLTGSTGTIQWQISTDNVTFTNIASATAATYTPGALAATTYYRALVSSAGGCTSISNVITVKVVPPSTLTEVTCSNNGTFENSTDDFLQFKITPATTSNYNVTATYGGSPVSVKQLDNSAATNIMGGLPSYFKVSNGTLSVGGTFTITLTPVSGSVETLTFTNTGTCSNVCTSASSGNTVTYYYYAPVIGQQDSVIEPALLPKFDQSNGRLLTNVSIEYGANYMGGVIIESKAATSQLTNYQESSINTFNISGYTLNRTVSLFNSGLVTIPAGISVPAQGSWLGDVNGLTMERMSISPDAYWLNNTLLFGQNPTTSDNWVTNITGNPTHDDMIILNNSFIPSTNTVNYSAQADLNNFIGTGNLSSSFSNIVSTSLAGSANLTFGQRLARSYFYKITYTYECGLVPTSCYKPAVTDGNTYPSKHGITALGRGGSDNGNWPMARQSAWTVLEAKTKGFVINRVKFNASNQPVAADGVTLAITNPVEGMMVYDTTNNCLKVYTSADGGINFSWHCMNTQACP